MRRAMPRRLPPPDACVRVRAVHSHDQHWCSCFRCEQVFQLRETVIEVSHETEHLGYLCPRCHEATAAALKPRLLKLVVALRAKADHFDALAQLPILPLSPEEKAHASALMDQCFECRQNRTLREMGPRCTHILDRTRQNITGARGGPHGGTRGPRR